MKLPLWGKITIALVAVLIALVAGVYAAGFLFLIANKTNPLETSFSTIYQYWYYYRHDPQQAGHFKFAFIGGALVVIGMCSATLVGMVKKKRSLHGDARFADRSEVGKAGLYGGKGIIIGKAFGRFLILGGQQFVALAAPTRSGKGVSIVIPNLLNYAESVVVLDVKQENHSITSGYREKYGQEVFLFNPFAADCRTHRWNPLSYISEDRNFVVNDILSIGYILYPREGKDSFFNDQARNLFLGLVLYLVETPELPRTISEALRQSSGKGKPLKKYLTDLMADRDNSDRPLSDSCVEALLRFTSNSENTLASILASFNAPLTIWASPIVDAATSDNDFWLTDVRKKRMSIYVGVTPDKLAQASLILNLFFSQLIDLNTRELPQKNPKLSVECLILLDEFTAPGPIEIINKSVSYQAGYGLRLMPIFQSKSQLDPVYGEKQAQTILTNHACQIYFPPREQKDANEYSEMLGYITEKSTSVSSNRRGALSLGGGSNGESVSDQRRALLLPQELKELDRSKEIIMLENVKPIMAEKVSYFSDEIFVGRLKEISPSLSKVSGIPSRVQLEEAIFAGELSSNVPVIDLDLHVARVESRVRFMTEDDLNENADTGAFEFDINALAHDFSDLPEVDDPDNPSEESTRALVSAFFDKLENRDDRVTHSVAEYVDEDGVISVLNTVEDASFDLSVLDDGENVVLTENNESAELDLSLLDDSTV